MMIGQQYYNTREGFSLQLSSTVVVVVFEQGHDDGERVFEQRFANWFRVCRGSQNKKSRGEPKKLTPHHIFRTKTSIHPSTPTPKQYTVVARVKTCRKQQFHLSLPVRSLFCTNTLEDCREYLCHRTVFYILCMSTNYQQRTSIVVVCCVGVNFTGCYSIDNNRKVFSCSSWLAPHSDSQRSVCSVVLVHLTSLTS